MERLLTGTVLTSVFAIGVVMIVVIVATSSPGGHPDAGQPRPGQLARFVVACGLLGLAMLGELFPGAPLPPARPQPPVTPRRPHAAVAGALQGWEAD